MPAAEDAVSRSRSAGLPPHERIIAGALFACALLSVLTLLVIVAVLASESLAFLTEVPIAEFLTGTRWSPLFTDRQFGVLPLLNGTVLVALGALLVGLPIGLASAVYLSEIASPRTRTIVKPLLEVLAGIPTVVWGYFALMFVTPIVRAVFPAAGVFNAASASLVVGVMIVPMVATLSEDALRSVSTSLREGALALGATRFEATMRVVIPAAGSGIAASFLLALGRAVSETMIVTLAAGATPRMTASFLDSVQTMTAYIIQASLGDTPYGSQAYRTMFAVGLLLFVITLVANGLARRLRLGFRRTGP
jgi:phosphate transport system permease protein